MLFIGDSSVDIQTAKNAGMVPLGVLWGNGSLQELSNAVATEIFSEVFGLKGFIEEIIY